MRNAIDLAFQKSKVKRRPLLISYTVCGDPNKKKSLEILKSINLEDEKNSLMKKFTSGEIQCLISTTVIELSLIHI